MPDRLYWDACCFLSYINQIPDRVATLEAYLAKSAKGDVQIVTSVISITEVAFALFEQTKKALSSETEARIERLWSDRKAIMVVELHEIIARKARDIIRDGLPRGWSLKPGDAIHLATAAYLGATEIHTYDGKLERYGQIINIPVHAPVLAQGELGI